jgi:hypothetical protein
LEIVKLIVFLGIKQTNMENKTEILKIIELLENAIDTEDWKVVDNVLI